MIIAIDSRSLEGPKTGVGRYLSNLLRYWKNKKEHEFVLYFKDLVPEDDLIESDNFQIKLLKNPLGFSSNFFFQHFLLPYNLKKDKADFFFSPFYLKPLFCPIKSSITLHDVSYEAHPEWFDFLNRFILGKLSKLSAKTANVIFTVSNFSKSEIIKYYKINSDKIRVTYLAHDSGFVGIKDNLKHKSLNILAERRRHIDVSPSESGADNNIIKQKYNLNDKFILSVGSIFNRRRIPEIIKTFEKIARKYGNYQLLIIGKNHTYPFINIDERIKTANENLGRKAIIRLDFVEDEELAVLYGLCEFVVYLSDYEGFGLPVIEAQFFDKPVVTSHNSSLVEVGGDSVEFVGGNSIEEIYNSLERLILDEGYRNKLVKLGNKNVKRFSWEKCAKETLNVILKQ